MSYQLDKFIALLTDLQTLSFTNKIHLLLLTRVIFKFISYITLLLYLKPCVAGHCTMSEMLTSPFDLVNVRIPFCLVSPSSPGTALFSTLDALFSHAFWSQKLTSSALTSLHLHLLFIGLENYFPNLLCTGSPLTFSSPYYSVIFSERISQSGLTNHPRVPPGSFPEYTSM